MRAAAYQRSELARDRSWGPGAPSIKSCGLEFDSRAKKKSGPWPAQAVPSLSSLASKVAVIASRRAGPGIFASSMSWGAGDFSAAKVTGGALNTINVIPATTSARNFLDREIMERSDEGR